MDLAARFFAPLRVAQNDSVALTSLMRKFYRILTSLVFAAHAVLGCGAHAGCQHGAPEFNYSNYDRSDHDSFADHHRDSAPCDDEHAPSPPCRHAACSFVKAESVRVNPGDGLVAWALLPMPVGHTIAIDSRHGAVEPLCKADLSSAQIYVWHCALLI